MGGSCGPNSNALLWEQGAIYDLNALIAPPASALHLVEAHGINDRGEIVAIGEHLPPNAPALSVGQLVTVNPLAYCGNCAYCKHGLNQLCPNRRLIGAHRPGAFAIPTATFPVT